MWPPDPGSIAIGGLIGSLFWLYALGRYFPKKFEDAETRIEEKVETRIRDGITEFKADVKKEVDSGIDGFITRFSDPEDEKANMLIAAMTGRAIVGITTSEQTREMFKPFIKDLVDDGLVEFQNRLGMDPQMMAQTMEDMRLVVETVKAYLPQKQEPGQPGQPQAPMGGLMGMFAQFASMFGMGRGNMMGLPQLGP